MNGISSLMQSLSKELTPPLGSNRLSPAPFNFCANNARQCAYWRCIFDNIKNSEEVKSLKSAAKILSDPELRHAFATSPELQEAACDVRGPNGFSCQIFRSLLKLTDGLSPVKRTIARPAATRTNRFKRKDSAEDDGESPDFEDVPLNRAIRDVYRDYYDGKVSTKYSRAMAAAATRAQKHQMKDCDAILTGRAYYPEYFQKVPTQQRRQRQRNRSVRVPHSRVVRY